MVAFTCLAGPQDELLTDVTARTGIHFKLENSATSQKYLPETMAGGVALLDFDNDGRLDIFLTNGARLNDPMARGKHPDKSDPRFWNRLYHQNSDGTFTDVTREAGVAGAGYSMGVAVGDYDNDGFEDLFVTGLEAATLYHNNGNGTFTDVTEKAGVRSAGWSTSAGFFDYNNDGKLDLFVARYVEWDFQSYPSCKNPVGGRDYCHPKLLKGAGSILFRNNGDGTFSDLSNAAGIAGLKGKGLGVAFADYDNDGWTDVYVANDSMPSYLFHNNGNGTFSELGLGMGVAYNEDGEAFAGMGVDFADYDNDGLPDLVVTDLAKDKYMLFRNRGDGSFSSETDSSGLARASLLFSGWGVKWVDLDNDGWKDLFAAQGHISSIIDATEVKYRQPALLLRNDHARLRPWGDKAGSALSRLWVSRGVAVGDLDNDGGVDIVVSNIGQNIYVLHNNAGPKNHWLGIKTEGTRSNRDGIGCRIKAVAASGLAQYYTVSTAASYLSANDRRVVIGLGADTVIRLLEVRWPSGVVQRLENVQSGQWLTVKEPQ